MSNRVGIDHLIRGYRGTLSFTGCGWVARDKVPLNCPIELGMAGVVAVKMANES